MSEPLSTDGRRLSSPPAPAGYADARDVLRFIDLLVPPSASPAELSSSPLGVNVGSAAPTRAVPIVGG